MSYKQRDEQINILKSIFRLIYEKNCYQFEPVYDL